MVEAIDSMIIYLGDKSDMSTDEGEFWSLSEDR
jgi:hypothetical protein